MGDFLCAFDKVRKRMISWNRREIKPDWMRPGALVKVLPASREKVKKLTIRTVEWPWLVSFVEEPTGCCHPNRVIGLVEEHVQKK